MSITIQPVRAISDVPIVSDTTVGAMDTVASLSVSVYKGERAWLSAVLLNDSTDGEYTVEVDIPGLAVDVKYVLVMYRGQHSYIDYRNFLVPAPTEIEGIECPTLLTNNPALVTSTYNADPLLTTSTVHFKGGGSAEITDRTRITTNHGYHDPDWIIEDATTLQPVTLKTNVNQQVVITIPEQAVAGSYSGSLTVKLSGSVEATKPITVTVEETSLAATTKPYLMYYHPSYKASYETTKPTVFDSQKTRVQLQSDLSKMSAMGVQLISYQSFTDSIADFNKYMDDVVAAGIDVTDFYTQEISCEGRVTQQDLDDLEAEIADAESKLEPYGTTQLWVMGEDEARGAAITDQFPAFDVARAAGAKVYATCNYDDVAAYQDKVDMIIPAFSCAKSTADTAHLNIASCLNYGFPQSAPESPYEFRRNYGLFNWANDYDGAAVYAYQRIMGDAWNDMDQDQYRPHYMAYPCNNGAIDTPAVMGMRQAQQDMAIIDMLEAAIAAYPGSAADSAQGWLDAQKAASILSPNIRVVTNNQPDLYNFTNTAKTHYAAIVPNTSNLLTDSFNTFALTLDNPTDTPTVDGAVIGCTTNDTSGTAYAMVRTDRQWHSVANGDSQALADADKATIIAQDITAPELVWAGTDEDLATIQLTIDGLAARLDPANPYYGGWVQV